MLKLYELGSHNANKVQPKRPDGTMTARRHVGGQSLASQPYINLAIIDLMTLRKKFLANQSAASENVAGGQAHWKYGLHIQGAPYALARTNLRIKGVLSLRFAK
jgi:hypothetical protein